MVFADVELCFSLSMFRTSLNQLRLVLMLRHTRELLCIHSSSLKRDDVQRCTSLTPPHSLVSRGFSDVLDSPKHVCPPATIRICTRFLLAHGCMNWLHIPMSLSMPLLHTSPSQTPSNPLESSIRRCCYALKHSTHSTSVFRRWSSMRPDAVQTLRTGPRRTAMDECLSAGNEARCKCSMQANAALYAREGQSWAAVLVCLCAVRGDPALLFTLRSAKLKGRHKGDVRYLYTILYLLHKSEEHILQESKFYGVNVSN